MLQLLADGYLPLKQSQRFGISCKPVLDDLLLFSRLTDRLTLIALWLPVSGSTARYTSAKVPFPKLS